MSFKKGFGALIAVGIVIVIGIELWTVSTMFWTELVGGTSSRNPESSAKVSNSRTFSLGSVEGRFEKFRLQAGDKDWAFHLKLQLIPTTGENLRVIIRKLRIDADTEYPIDQIVDLENKESQTVSISQRIEPATSPDALLLSVEQSGTSSTGWVPLPKVPVRAVN